MADVSVVLDPAIRTWILLPMVAVVFLFGLLRPYLEQLVLGPRTASASSATRDELVEKVIPMSLLQRSMMLRENGSVLREEAYVARVQYLKQALTAALAVVRPPVNAMMDPSMMGQMMKNNVLGLVQHYALVQFFTSLFSGYIVAKFPFPLPEGFRALTQRDIELPELDVSYATSFSLYFLIQLCMRGLFVLIQEPPQLPESVRMQLAAAQAGQHAEHHHNHHHAHAGAVGSPAPASAAGGMDAAMGPGGMMMMPGMPMPGMGAPGGAPDLKKLIQEEIDSLEVARHVARLASAEVRLLSGEEWGASPAGQAAREKPKSKRA